MPFFTRTFFAALLALAVAGCTSTQQWLEEQPPSFRQGYEDGCKNGRERVENSYLPKTNDTARYRDDPEYKKGWDSGYDDCKFDKKTDIMMQRSHIMR